MVIVMVMVMVMVIVMVMVMMAVVMIPMVDECILSVVGGGAMKHSAGYQWWTEGILAVVCHHPSP